MAITQILQSSDRFCFILFLLTHKPPTSPEPSHIIDKEKQTKHF